MRMSDTVLKAAQRWPGIDLKLHCSSRGEYTAACPWCGGTDRFHVWERGNYECMADAGHHGCGRKGWVDEQEARTLTPEERRQLELERRVAELERRQKEHETRLTLLEQMHRCTDHVRYHYNLDVVPGAREYWEGEGIWKETQDAYQLGYCGRCPTDSEGRPAYTIPLFVDGQLENIRHRLIGAENGDKYRPHMAGLGAQLFNVDLLQHNPDFVILGEGEKKAIVASQWGFPTVSICGKHAWKTEWAEAFATVPTVYVCLDPDAPAAAETIAARLGERARVVNLPVKLDDFFSPRIGGDPDKLERFLRCARPVRTR